MEFELFYERIELTPITSEFWFDLVEKEGGKGLQPWRESIVISWMNATKRSYIVFKGNKKRTNVEREDFNESVLFAPFLTLAVKKKSQGWRAEAASPRCPRKGRCSQPRSPLCRLPTSLSSSSRWSGTFCHIKLGDRRLEFVFTLPWPDEQQKVRSA